MNPRGRPDPAARWAAHALVGLSVGALVGRESGEAGFWVSALLAAALHEALDAPVATFLAQLGL